MNINNKKILYSSIFMVVLFIVFYKIINIALEGGQTTEASILFVVASIVSIIYYLGMFYYINRKPKV